MSVWAARPTTLGGRPTTRFVVTRAEQPATFADVIAGLRDDPALRAALTGWIARAPYAAARWETPGVTEATTSQPFEFVLVDSPELLVAADLNPFGAHFARAAGGAVTFTNLGGDATLVVPAPRAALEAYPHLAAFARAAPAAQQDALWRAVGEAMAARISARPVWLSTAGAGVAWLHVRLDDRPKYYAHGPYRAR